MIDQLRNHIYNDEQDLITWIRNNWRLGKETSAESVAMKVKRTDVVWLQHREMVFEEIASLLGIQTADTTTPGWFGKRLPAIANIIDRMTRQQRQELDDEVSRMSREGYPEETRRR